MRVNCPYCRSVCVVVKSNPISFTYKEATAHCMQAHCGLVFVVAVEPVRILSPSAIAAPPGVRIPLSTHINVKAIQMDLFNAEPKAKPKETPHAN